VESTAEYDLAWDLAAAVDPVLTADDRVDIFTKIGAGDTYAAIEQLLSCAQKLDFALGPELLARAAAWLAAYAGSDEEARLRAVLATLGRTPRAG
jgi:hypothetical protein